MYKVTVNLLPQDTTLNEKWQVLQAVHSSRETITQSADDAVYLCTNGDTGSKVKVWWQSRWSESISRWLLDRGVQIVEHHPQSPPAPTPNPGVKIGIHASADPGVVSESELQEFKDVSGGVIKVLSAHSSDTVAELSSIPSTSVLVVRAFLAFGDRVVSPDDFVAWTKDDIQRTLDNSGGKDVYLEIHNEPNLAPEGLYMSWADGSYFSAWLNAVAGKFRALWPSLKLMYPGLSPGGDIPGLRQAHSTFIDQSQDAVNNLDALGVHLYWSDSYPMYASLSVLDGYIAKFPNKEIWVTEASHNTPGPTPSQKAEQYIQFWQALKQKPNVAGVTYYVASASNPNFGWASGSCETWIENGVSLGIGKIIGQR